MGEEPLDLTYREQDVDDTLDEHGTRIKRLEKAVLIMLGYGIAEGSDILMAFTQLF